MASVLSDRLPWAASELAELRRLIALELPMTHIARKLNRPEQQVRRTAHRVAMADMLRMPPPPPAWIALRAH